MRLISNRWLENLIDIVHRRPRVSGIILGKAGLPPTSCVSLPQPPLMSRARLLGCTREVGMWGSVQRLGRPADQQSYDGCDKDPK